VVLTAEGFGGKNDLMLGIHQSLSVVSLEHPMRGGHFHGVIVNDIALDFFAIVATLGFLLLQKLVQSFHLELEPLFLFLLTLKFEIGLVV
jgi:hypothetical protein